MENPLKELFKTKKIDAVAVESGVSPNTLRNLSRMLPEEVFNMKLGTNEMLKENLGIDMVDYLKDRTPHQENEENN